MRGSSRERREGGGKGKKEGGKRGEDNIRSLLHTGGPSWVTFCICSISRNHNLLNMMNWPFHSWLVRPFCMSALHTHCKNHNYDHLTNTCTDKKGGAIFCPLLATFLRFAWNNISGRATCQVGQVSLFHSGGSPSPGMPQMHM